MTDQINNGGDLLTCPFCGGEAHLVSRPPRIPFVECRTCCIEQAGTTEADAAAAWNSRTPSHGKASGEIASKAQEIVAIANRYQGAEEDDQAPVPVDVLRAAAMIVNQAALAPMLDTMAAPIPVEGEVEITRDDYLAAHDLFEAEQEAEGQTPFVKIAAYHFARHRRQSAAKHRLTFSRGVDEVREAGQFLLDRLVDQGYVTPAMARFRAALHGDQEG